MPKAPVSFLEDISGDILDSSPFGNILKSNENVDAHFGPTAEIQSKSIFDPGG